MKAVVRVNDRLTIEVEKEKMNELLKELSAVNSFFEDSECGACKGKDLIVSVRSNGGFDFTEMACKNPKCRARLSYGTDKETKEQYPVRCDREKEGKNKGHAKRGPDGKALWLPNNGWVKYVPESA